METPLMIIADIRRFEKLGGRDSFFGMKHIFEFVLKRTHVEIGADKEEGGFRFKGIGQYGNIIYESPTTKACEICKSKSKFTVEEFKSLIGWYEHRNTVDTITLAILIKLWLFNAGEIDSMED